MTSQSCESPDRDHMARQPTSWAGGVSHVGRKIPPNQDALAIAATADPRPRSAVVAVSDGVSTSYNSHLASGIAVEAACDSMINYLRQHPDADVNELTAAMIETFRVANEAILSQAKTRLGSYACTLVLAVLHRRKILVANLGDSRAYWFGDNGVTDLLSVDDSLAQLSIELGAARDVAEQSSHAHAITKWLGPDSPSIQPRVVLRPGNEPGWLLTCTDGLWNDASEPVAMKQVLDEALAHDRVDAVGVSARLVAWALGQTTRDNITVALVRVDESVQPTPEVTAPKVAVNQDASAATDNPAHDQDADLEADSHSADSKTGCSSGTDSAQGEQQEPYQPALPLDR